MLASIMFVFCLCVVLLSFCALVVVAGSGELSQKLKWNREWNAKSLFREFIELDQIDFDLDLSSLDYYFYRFCLAVQMK